MKQFMYSLFTLLVLGFTAFSCNKEIENEDKIILHDQTPEITAAGEYVGTWTRTSSTDTLTAGGSIVIAATDTAYIARVTYASSDFSLNKTAKTNISYAGTGCVYYNNSATNEMGTTFAGRITQDSTNTVTFQLSQREGRKLKTFTYYFTGRKQ